MQTLLFAQQFVRQPDVQARCGTLVENAVRRDLPQAKEADNDNEAKALVVDLALGTA